MANKKLSQLFEQVNPTTGDLTLLSSSGNSYKGTLDGLARHFNNQYFLTHTLDPVYTESGYNYGRFRFINGNFYVSGFLKSISGAAVSGLFVGMTGEFDNLTVKSTLRVSGNTQLGSGMNIVNTLSGTTIVNNFSGTNVSGNAITSNLITTNSFTGTNVSGRTIIAYDITGTLVSGGTMYVGSFTGTNVSGANVYANNFVGGNITGRNVTGETFVATSLVNFTGATTMIQSSAPATTGSAGTKGTVTFNNDYLYVCVANNQWRRTVLADF